MPPALPSVLSTWGFALYLASSGETRTTSCPPGLPFGSPEEALDYACGLYLDDPTTWSTPLHELLRSSTTVDVTIQHEQGL